MQTQGRAESVIFVDIFLREGRVYLPTLAITRDGIITTHEPVMILTVSEPQKLAAAVAAAASEPLPHVELISPSVLDRKPGVLARAAKVRSWSAFARTARRWVLRSRGAELVLKSNHHAYNLGFQEDEEPVRTWPSDSDRSAVANEVAEVVLRAAAAPGQ